VSALVCLVTKKLVRLTKYAVSEFTTSSSTKPKFSRESWSALSMAPGSRRMVAGISAKVEMGAMYSSRFIEFSFSASAVSRIPCAQVARGVCG
jgi:hypothetical protein